MSSNPLYDAWLERVGSNDEISILDMGVDRWLKARAGREEFCHRYAWAIPDDKALDLMAQHKRIVEIGAGTGYWASLLAARGVDIVAYDIAPPPTSEERNHWHSGARVHHPVMAGGPDVAAAHPGCALFLCWPPYDSPMAADCLRAYRGRFVIYVGEGTGGCTADDTFHEMLDKEWGEVVVHRLPQWPGIHDTLAIYARRAK